MSEYLDIVEERDGYRVRLELDDDVQEPYDDGAVPILRIGGDYYGGGDAEAFNSQASGFENAFNRFAEYAGTNAQQREMFARYVRIFHGALKVQEYNVGISREYGYLGFDTAAWREKVGAPATLEDEDYLSEVRAWAEGDVYGYIVERSYSADGLEDDEPSWEAVADGSVWGFYGRRWAEQAAREALTSAIEWDVSHPAPEVTAASEAKPELVTMPETHKNVPPRCPLCGLLLDMEVTIGAGDGLGYLTITPLSLAHVAKTHTLALPDEDESK